MQRKAWTTQQDQILKNLFEKVKLNKWSLIARQMQKEYGLPPRSGKQCRQRYNNHLNPAFAKEAWSLDEQNRLFALHNQLGNKWAIIAADIGGRTDNGVKNHFYAKLRKSMRRMNKLIQENFRRQLKEIKLNVLYKIVEASEEKFKKEPLCSLETSQYSCSLKNKILKIAEQGSQEPQNQQFITLVKQIQEFGKKYKRKPKQLRRIPTKSDHEEISSPKAQNVSESQLDDSNDQIIRPEPELETIKEEQTSKLQLRSSILKVAPQQLEDNPKGEAQNILKDIMHEDVQNELFNLPFSSRRNNASSDNMSNYSRRNEQFLQDSNFPYDFPPMIFKESKKQQKGDIFFNQQQ